MSSEEEDYMSMDFTVTPANDVRPGLLQTAKQRRELELLKRKQDFDTKSRTNKKKNLKVLEEEHREEGLRKPIEEDNRGFALLAKMGYKPGGGIGKTTEKQSNPTALIDITVKTSRKGLGLAERKPRVHSSNSNGRKIAVSAELSSSQLNAYRSALAAKHGERKILADLSRSQKACASLERDAGWTKPLEWWYWPRSEIAEEDNKKEEGDIADEDDDCAGASDIKQNSCEKIKSTDDKNIERYDSKQTSDHIHESEKTKASDSKDSNRSDSKQISDNIQKSDTTKDSKNKDINRYDFKQTSDVQEIHEHDLISDKSTREQCSNSNRKDTYVKDGRDKESDTDLYDVGPPEEDGVCDEEEEEKEYQDDLSTAEKLDILTQYLRSNYFYCIWCGTRYQDKLDLEQNCPGDNSDDH